MLPNYLTRITSPSGKEFLMRLAIGGKVINKMRSLLIDQKLIFILLLCDKYLYN